MLLMLMFTVVATFPLLPFKAGARSDARCTSMHDQPPVTLEWTDTARRQLPRCADWIRHTPEQLWCDVLSLTPRLRIPWCYADNPEYVQDVWECRAVWLHHAGMPNGAAYTAGLHRDLQEAVNAIPSRAQRTLLIDPVGMHDDANRLGDDLRIQVSSGRVFAFSVRRGMGQHQKLLLALCVNG